MITFIGCEGPTGSDGPQGPQGAQGEQGPEGPAGEDGNANITIITLNNTEIEWEEGSHLGRVANTFSFTAEEVNQDVMESGTVIGYAKISDIWYPLPFNWENSSGSTRQYVLFSFALETINLFAYTSDGVIDPINITDYRFLVLTDASIPGKINNEDQSVLEKLKSAGVNVANYHEVMNYFGLED